LIVFAEHRYYGESMPFAKNITFDREHIGYLSIEQAMADYATLILALKPQYNDANVVTFGGSYGGMLSGWMRMKYPFIVDMALAASAPFRVASLQVPPTLVFQTITETFAAANPACPDVIRSGFTEVISLANQGEEGMAVLSKVFKTCHPLKESQAHHLILWAVNAFPTLGMCDYPYPADFLAPLPAWPVKYACEQALAAPSTLEALAAVAAVMYNGTDGTRHCFDIEQEFVECADQSGCGTGPAGIAWDYQACTELIWFMNTNNVTDMFPPRNWTLHDLIPYCHKHYGITPRPDWLLEEFGSGNISTSATRIIFSNGLLDPWHVGGFLSNLSESLPAIVISVCFCLPSFHRSTDLATGGCAPP
jgi:dipeptidyl-peptidase-2